MLSEGGMRVKRQPVSLPYELGRGGGQRGDVRWSWRLFPTCSSPYQWRLRAPKLTYAWSGGWGSTRRPPRGQKRRQTERRRRAEPLLVAYDGRTEAGRRAPLPGSPAGKINLCVVTECEQRGYRVAASLERLAAAEAAWY